MYYKIIKTSTLKIDIKEKLDFLKNRWVSEKVLNDVFLTINWTIKSLDFYPHRFQKVYKDYRRTLIKKYSIFYKINEEEKEVLIYRVLHQSQNFKKYLN